MFLSFLGRPKNRGVCATTGVTRITLCVSGLRFRPAVMSSLSTTRSACTLRGRVRAASAPCKTVPSRIICALAQFDVPQHSWKQVSHLTLPMGLGGLSVLA